MPLIDYLASHALAFVLLAGLLGLIVGSFLNVVIHRLPHMMEREWRQQALELLEPDTEHPAAETYNLLLPHSHCPHCKTEIKAWQNLPIISYLILRGRCGQCRHPISARYPLVEALTAALSMVVAWQYGFNWAAGGMILLTWGLISLSMIDADTQLLPDALVLPLLWLGLIANSFGLYTDLNTALWGAIAGYLSLWSVYWVFKLITGKEGMGYGDFKLLAATGAWLGWQIIPGAILIAAITGLLYAMVASLRGKRESGKPIAFGPFLAVAGWVCLVNRDTVLSFFAA